MKKVAFGTIFMFCIFTSMAFAVTPLPPLPPLLFTIDQSGSYTLDFESTWSIEINASNVTIDLKGHSISGSGSGSGDGVKIANGVENIQIINGTIKNFDNGIKTIGSALYVKVINVRAVGNHQTGIYLRGGGHVVKDCVVSKNPGGGILVERNSEVSGCMVTENQSSSSGIGAINAGNFNVITENTVSFNMPSHGIVIGYFNRVKDNRVMGNDIHNIVVEGESNILDGNIVTQAGGGCGIRIGNDNNFIDGSRATMNSGGNYCGTTVLNEISQPTDIFGNKEIP